MKYRVVVWRIATGSKEYEVEATSPEDAEEKAISLACDDEFSTDGSTYDAAVIAPLTG